MTSPTLLDRIDAPVHVFVKDARQRLDAHHGAIDALAADVSLTEEQANLGLFEAKLQASLTETAVTVASRFDELSPELREAERFADHFLIEQGLLHRPSFGTFPDLLKALGLTMLVEQGGTAAIYAPVLGWPAGLAVATLISAAVTLPGALAGAGVAAIRHRLDSRIRWAGVAATALGAAIGGLAIASGAHFRALVVDAPRLASHPKAAIEAILGSFSENFWGVFVDPSNLGVAILGGGAFIVSALEAYRTVGYVGWRELAVAEAEARQAIVAVAEDALEEAKAALADIDKEIDRRVKFSGFAKWLLERLGKMDRDVRRSGEAGMAIGAKHRSAAYAQMMQVLREVAPQACQAFEDRACPAANAELADRTGFDAKLDVQIARHDKLIADERRVRPALAETLQRFGVGLSGARAKALNVEATASQRRGGGPALPGGQS